MVLDLAYDYHGQWDTNVAGQASVSNPHTSLKDMEDSVRLYLRAKIPLSKVNLGKYCPCCICMTTYIVIYRFSMVWTFLHTCQHFLSRLQLLGKSQDTLLRVLFLNRGYMKMTGGGFAGDCTLAPGYLAQFEIDDILRSGNQPTFDKNSQTYWIVEKVVY